MPMIGFLNNHPRASGYVTNFNDATRRTESTASHNSQNKDGIMVQKSCPLPDTDECFVSYGSYDALDAFLHYNYVEPHAYFVCSIPLTVQLHGVGTLIIETVGRPPQHKRLPEQLKDLVSYLPKMKLGRDNKSVALDFILIPQEQAPYSMRRVLGVALGLIATGLTEQAMQNNIENAEAYILDSNKEYFSEISNHCKLHEREPELRGVVKNAKQMAEIQCQKLESYRLFDKLR